MKFPFRRKPKEVTDLLRTIQFLDTLGIKYAEKIDLGGEGQYEISVWAKELNRIPAWHAFDVTFIFDSMGRFKKVGVYE
jgi:hypothetical protein